VLRRPIESTRLSISAGEPQIHYLGVEFAEQRSKGFWGTPWHHVDFSNLSMKDRSHNEQIANGCRPWIPKRVRGSSRHEHTRSCPCLNLILFDRNSQVPSEDIPHLIIMMMKVPRCNESRRSRRAAGVPPLGHNKSIVDGTKNVPRQWRSDHRCSVAVQRKSHQSMGSRTALPAGF
jgi:hypothetical protein